MQLNEQVEQPKEEMQLVVFKIADEEYAAPILDVKEIIKTTNITKVPNTPDFVEGIINLRGKIIVVINLLKRFAVNAEAQTSHIIIADVNNSLFGVTVDDVTEVLRTSKENMKKTPSIISTKIHTNYLKGVVVINERVIVLLDIQKLLSEKELGDLQEVTKTMKQPPQKITQKKETPDKQMETLIKNHFTKKVNLNDMPTREELEEVLGNKKPRQKKNL